MSGLHAYIVTGGGEAARESLAFRLAREALCSAADAPCGVCADCRKSLAHAHPDLHEVTPDERGAIKIEAARAMRDAAQVKPNEAARQVFLVHAADGMNAAAQNALLATVEEPPTPCVFIFVCENARSLLGTVRSRCGLVRAEDDAAAPDPASGGEDARALPRALIRGVRSKSGLVEAFAPFTKLKGDEAVRRLEEARSTLAHAAAANPSLASRALRGAGLASRAEDMLRANVTPAQVAAWLIASLI